MTFTTAVSALQFLGVGIEDRGAVALVDVFVSNVLAATLDVIGNASGDTPDLVDLTAFSNVTSIRIYNIGDTNGIGWDDFSFTVGADAVVPVPGSLALLGIALAGLGFSRRKQTH